MFFSIDEDYWTNGNRFDDIPQDFWVKDDEMSLWHWGDENQSIKSHGEANVQAITQIDGTTDGHDRI